MKKTLALALAALFTSLLALPALAAPEARVYWAPPLGGSVFDESDGFDCELWSQKGNDGTMVLTGAGNFECSWDAFNILFRTGTKLGSTKTYEDYGTVIMDYGAEHNITRGDASYLCMYGWTENPMIEFYIVENHGTYKPPGGVGFQGTYEADGSEYEVYINTRVQQPSIHGTKTFEQYFAVRVDKRTEGTITISEHFKEWDKLGLDMSGTMFEVSLCMEGYNSAGNANIYSHRLTIGEDVYGYVTEKPAAAFVPPALPPKDRPGTTPQPAAPAQTDTPAAVTDRPAVTNPKTGIESRVLIALGALAVGVAGLIVLSRRIHSR